MSNALLGLAMWLVGYLAVEFVIFTEEIGELRELWAIEYNR